MCQLCGSYWLPLSCRFIAGLSSPASPSWLPLPCAVYVKSLVPGGPLSGRSLLCTSSVPGPCEAEDLIDGIIFAANYLGSTQLLSERNPSKNIRMMQAQEAVSRVKVGYFWALRVALGGPLEGALKWRELEWGTGALSKKQAWSSVSKEAYSLAGKCSAGHRCHWFLKHGPLSLWGMILQR